jgi:hypothetical protein
MDTVRVLDELAEMRKEFKIVSDNMIVWHTESVLTARQTEKHLAALNSKVAEHERINGLRAIDCALHERSIESFKSDLVNISTRVGCAESDIQKNKQTVAMVKGGYVTAGVIFTRVAGVVAFAYTIVRLVISLIPVPHVKGA